MGRNIVHFNDPNSDPSDMEAMMLPDLSEIITYGVKVALIRLAIFVVFVIVVASCQP